MKKKFLILTLIFSMIASMFLFVACKDSDDEVISAKFEVTFVANGGSAVAPITDIVSGSLISKPTDPTKADFVFGGWYKDSALVTPFDFMTDKITANTTLYAKWTPVTPPVEGEFDVTFVANGGSDVAPFINIISGTYIFKPTDPTKADFVFGGWYKDSALVTPFDFTKDKITANTTLYAKWTPVTPPVEVKFEVTFFVDGGSAVAPITDIVSGSLIARPADPTKADFVFGGWYKDSALVTPFNFTLDKIISNTTLYAKWTPVTPPVEVKFEVTFFVNGGSAVAPITDIVSGSLISRPTDPTKADFVFGGWYKDIEFGAAFDFTLDKIIANTTLYAKWTPVAPPVEVKFDVNFVVYGGSAVAPITDIVSGSLISKPTDPTKADFVFGGWYKDIEFGAAFDFTTDKIIDNTTLYAKWTPVAPPVEAKFEVTFFVNGGSAVAPITDIVSGSLIARPADPTKADFVFGGWYKDIELSAVFDFTTDKIIDNTTLYAKWTKNTDIYKRINKDGSLNPTGDYILFGEYPQTIKADNVTISGKRDERNYVLGSDNNYYWRSSANTIYFGSKFSNGVTIVDKGDYYYKVEPIKWRILDEKNGSALLLCEMILGYDKYSVKEDSNYGKSDIRVFLNDRFYNRAFVNLDKQLIQTTEVDNSAQSTGIENNRFACANTQDKIFLPSYKDLTNANYGFNADEMVADVLRVKFASDYTRGCGISISDQVGAAGWWLRSPHSEDNYVRAIGDKGMVAGNFVTNEYGIVPALTLKL